MILGFLMTITTWFLIVYNKIVGAVEFPDWFSDILISSAVIIWDLNGFFPIHVFFEIALAVVSIHIIRLIAVAATFIINIFRGSGAKPPV